MLETFAALLDQALGLHAEKLNLYQMILRTLIVYVYIVAVVRIGDRRFFGKHAVFDGVLAIVLGSVISRAINGQALFFPTLGATAFLVALHWLTAFIAFHHKGFQRLVEDDAIVLLKDGVIQWDEMQHGKITEADLMESLRGKGVDNPNLVKAACFEPNGKISVVKRAMVVDIDVKAGVQTVRVDIGS
jgi:uncharacterized membrane protein YcaP (DUF421 family)